jgi:hypothetical protein
VRPRLAAAARLARRKTLDPATTLRLGLLRETHAAVVALDAKERDVTRQLTVLVRASGSTLRQLCGLSTRSVAELLVEVGEPRRFTEGGFARFNRTAPLRRRPPKVRTSPSGTAGTEPATAGSTPSSTAWPSPSCATNSEPRPSTATPAARPLQEKKPAGSSSAT